jgi:hypothetical protein
MKKMNYNIEKLQEKAIEIIEETFKTNIPYTSSIVNIDGKERNISSKITASDYKGILRFVRDDMKNGWIKPPSETIHLCTCLYIKRDDGKMEDYLSIIAKKIDKYIGENFNFCDMDNDEYDDVLLEEISEIMWNVVRYYDANKCFELMEKNFLKNSFSE